MKLKTLFFPIGLVGLVSCIYITDEESLLLADWDRDGFNIDEDCDDGNDMIFPESQYEIYGDGLDWDCDGYDDPVCAWRLQYVESCDTAACTSEDIALLQGWVASGGNPEDFPDEWSLTEDCSASLGM